MRSFIKGLLAATVFVGAGVALFPQASGAQSYTAPTEPVLIELFTSQGCSSCPPADRLAERLDQEGGLVVISRPVDYWDRLGWKDTLASPANTALQRSYASRGLSGYNGVYTPQSVVAGSFGEVGSDESALRAQIETARRTPNTARLRVQAAADRGFAIGLAGAAEREADVWLYSVSSREDIAIGRGENRGRTVRYTNALIQQDRLGAWRGGKASFAIPAERMQAPGADRYAVVVQETGHGRVIAASWLE